MHKECIDAAFPIGWEMHGDLHFDANLFGAHLEAICTRYLASAKGCASREELLESLHVADLYLALGCARGCERAWTIFSQQFHGYIVRLAAAVLKCADDAAELAGVVMVDLYIPDRCGTSRIASYDGRSTLGTWLRVLVSHRAITQHRRNRVRTRLFASLPDRMDEISLATFDSEPRVHRYQHAVQSALDRACSDLSERDRQLLLLRFGARTKLQKLAAYLEVHPSNASREVKRLCARIRTRVIRVLGDEYKLSRAAIEECLSDIVENPTYSMLTRLESHARDAANELASARYAADDGLALVASATAQCSPPGGPLIAEAVPG